MNRLTDGVAKRHQLRLEGRPYTEAEHFVSEFASPTRRLEPCLTVRLVLLLLRYLIVGDRTQGCTRDKRFEASTSRCLRRSEVFLRSTLPVLERPQTHPGFVVLRVDQQGLQLIVGDCFDYIFFNTFRPPAKEKLSDLCGDILPARRVEPLVICERAKNQTSCGKR